jgi:hypothetical protein
MLNAPRIPGPKGHESVAQALAWVSFSSASRPERATENGERRRNSETADPGFLDSVRFDSDAPTGRTERGPHTQGKPWAKFSSPCGAQIDLFRCRLLAVIAARALQGFRIKNCIVWISREGLALKPGRPPEQCALAQRNSRYGGGFYDALKIPIELLIYIVEYPIL